MSSFYRPQQLIQQITLRNLQEIAESEGPDAMEFGKSLDVGVDFDLSKNGYRVNVSWRGRQSFGFIFGMNESTAMAMKVEDMDEQLTAFMKKNLSLAAQLLHARLDKQFPNAIQRVETEHVAATCSKNFNAPLSCCESSSVNCRRGTKATRPT